MVTWLDRHVKEPALARAAEIEVHNFAAEIEVHTRKVMDGLLYGCSKFKQTRVFDLSEVSEHHTLYV